MTNSVIILCSIIALLIAGFAAYLFWAQKKFGELEEQVKNPKNNSGPLRLGAYERLTLFAERCKLDNLVNRLFDSSLNGRQMQQLIISSIRDEYEHNVTQQIYIQPEVWEAISKMKDQNMYVVNQIGAMLPAGATALDLNKKILEFTLTNPDATMNKLVLEAIQYEAKKLMA